MALKASIFDIDGAPAMRNKAAGTYAALPGAVAAMQTCRDAGLAVVAYTNGTIYPPAHSAAPLAKAGIDRAPGHMVTPANVVAHELARLGHKRVMVLAADGVTTPVAEAGIEVVPPKKAAGLVDAVPVGRTHRIDVEIQEAAAEALWSGVPLYATPGARPTSPRPGSE
ncbi:hypothetical protein [Mesobacterium pallidum]|uniref:hypothetical protein n=1 Tax=Mesobacterium pallidum TaxID=2872037 RepID=UPI001EE37680|nr:hypothetical protein [Mesobacterium pallidum]